MTQLENGLDGIKRQRMASEEMRAFELQRENLIGADAPRHLRLE